jgi:hypothetical protein
MKRYHFSIGGGDTLAARESRGNLGIAGELFANSDDDAVEQLQAFLDGDATFAIIEDGPGTGVSVGLAYASLCVNQPITVSIEDFDEIVAVDEDGNDVTNDSESDGDGSALVDPQ